MPKNRKPLPFAKEQREFWAAAIEAGWTPPRDQRLAARWRDAVSRIPLATAQEMEDAIIASGGNEYEIEKFTRPIAKPKPKKTRRRKIRFLTDKLLTDGTIAYYWEPSATRKKQGWPAQRLGTDQAAACRAAIELNAKLDAWLAGGAAALERKKAEPPRLIRFAGLVERYKASADYRDLRDTTKRNYDSHLRALSTWAMDGELPIAHIDEDMVQDLRDTLVEAGRKHRTAALLRTLRLLLGWAKDRRLVTTNVATGAKIPEPPSRPTVIPYDAMLALVAAVRGTNAATPDTALIIELAFWTAQRQADLLALTRFQWREFQDIDPRDAAMIAGPDGRCMGFRLQQQKTKAWVDVFCPPHLHRAVEQRLRDHGRLCPHPTQDGAPLHAKALQRQWAATVATAQQTATADGHAALAADLDGIQFRDLRRSGLTFYGDAQVPMLNITNVSGHSVMGRKTIMDTYVKTNPARSAACLAQGLRHAQRLTDMKEKQG